MYKLFKIYNPSFNRIYVGITKQKYLSNLLSQYKDKYRKNTLKNQGLNELFDYSIDNVRIYLITEKYTKEDIEDCYTNYMKKFGEEFVPIKSNRYEYKHQYYLNNKEKISDYNHQYYENNKS